MTSDNGRRSEGGRRLAMAKKERTNNVNSQCERTDSAPPDEEWNCREEG